MKLIAILALLITLVSCGHDGKKGDTGPAGPAGPPGPAGNSNPLIEYFMNEQNERYLGEYNNLGGVLKPTRGELETLGVHTTTTGFDQAAGIDQNLAIIHIDPDGGGDDNARRYFLVDLSGFPGAFGANFNSSQVYNYITGSAEVWKDSDLPDPADNSDLYRSTMAVDGTTKFYFSEDSDTSKDLESMGANVEALQVADMEENLINYGLSTDRAETLGKLMTSYSKIKNKRGLTAREKDVFTKELTGLSFDRASEVLVDEGYDSLVERASEVNGADPEAIKELLNEVL